MNPRTFLNFFKTKTGQVTAFGIVFAIAACLLTGVQNRRCSGCGKAHQRILSTEF